MLRYKVNVLEELKRKGFSTYKLLRQNLLSGSTVQKLRNGQPLSWSNIDALCSMLDCQPGDLIEYVADESDSQ